MDTFCPHCCQRLQCDDSLDGCYVECCYCRKTFIASSYVFFSCPNCRTVFHVPEDSDSYMFYCPRCNNLLDVTRIGPN